MPRLDALRLVLARPSTTGALAAFFIAASVLLLGLAGQGLSRAPSPTGVTWALLASGPSMDDVTGSISPAKGPASTILLDQAGQERAQRLGQGDGPARRAVDRDMDEMPLRGSLAPASPEHADPVAHR